MPTGASAVTPQPARRSVNLSSAAFDFAFDTPCPPAQAGKTEKGKGKAREYRPLGALGAFGSEWATPIKEERATPLRQLAPGVGEGTIAGPSTVDTRHGRNEVKTELDTVARAAAIPSKTPRKLTELSSVTTPWTSRDRQADAGGTEKRRRLSDLNVQVPSPKIKAEAGEDLRRRVGLQTVGDGVRLDEITVDDVDEKESTAEKEVGWGISPRKGRIKWTGKGDPPLALRLNALVTTQSSSLTLFYTSLAHTLNPSSRSSSTYRQSDIKTDPSVSVNVAVTPLEHIRTAPIRLRLLRPLPIREHAACLWLANVRKWPKAPQRLHIEDPEEDEDEVPPDEILVNFASAAKGASGLGADIKVITGRWWERHQRVTDQVVDAPGESDVEMRRWEVGVWSEWAIVDMPCQDVEDGREVTTSCTEESSKKVLFASRYLIAERGRW